MQIFDLEYVNVITQSTKVTGSNKGTKKLPIWKLLKKAGSSDLFISQDATSIAIAINIGSGSATAISTVYQSVTINP